MTLPDRERPVVWIHGEVKTPPFTREARIEAGVLLRRLQRGEHLAMPHLRPMPAIGPRCAELRIPDRDHTWRIVCRVDPDAIVVIDVFAKTTRRTPKHVIARCKRRLQIYDALTS